MWFPFSLEKHFIKTHFPLPRPPQFPLHLTYTPPHLNISQFYSIYFIAHDLKYFYMIKFSFSICFASAAATYSPSTLVFFYKFYSADAICYVYGISYRKCSVHPPSHPSNCVLCVCVCAPYKAWLERGTINLLNSIILNFNEVYMQTFSSLFFFFFVDEMRKCAPDCEERW